MDAKHLAIYPYFFVNKELGCFLWMYKTSDLLDAIGKQEE